MPPGGRSATGPGGRAGDAPAHGISPRARLAPLPRGTTGARRLGDRLALRALSLATGSGRTLGQSAAYADGPRLSGSAHRRGAADLPGAQPPDRFATAPGAAARTGPRLREPARVPRGRRPARHLLDGHGAARQPHHPPIPDRAQPAGVDRAGLRAADARARRGYQRRNSKTSGARARQHSSSTTPAPRQSRWRNWRSTPATASACWPMGRAFSSVCCPAAARLICGN